MQDEPPGSAQPRSATDTRATDDAARVSDSTERADQVVIPIVAEGISVETARVTRAVVRVHTHTETDQQTVETPLLHEEVVVERVPIDRLVEGAPPGPREENGVLIIPVLEETAVVEKRLVLREEVHVSCRRTTTTESRVMTLRHEVADVERVEESPKDRADREHQKKGGSS